MTIELFMVMLTVGAAASSLLTQAMKKAFKNLSSNMLALVDSVFIGGLGSIFAYQIMGIDFTPTNIIYIVLMAVCVWVGSMIGYDKVIQMIAQIKRG